MKKVLLERQQAIWKLEDRNLEMIQVEKRELRPENEETLWELSNSTREGDIRMMGIPEGEQREKRTESLFQEIIAENVPKLGKELDI